MLNLDNYKKKPWYKTIWYDIEFYFWNLFMLFPPLGFMILYFRYGESMEPNILNYYEYDKGRICS